MRAIIILICLLNQFAQVKCEKKRQDTKCDKVYNCFAPKKCTDFTKAIKGNSVERISFDTDIYDNCPGIFRYHTYLKNWVYLSIESLDPSISSITFKTFNPSLHSSRVFSCSYIDGKVIGKYGDKIKETSVKEDNLKCKFEVKLKSSANVFGDFTEVMFKINDEESRKSQYSDSTTHCDPSDLQYDEHESDLGKMIRKVELNLGEYNCKDKKNFKLQYKKNDKYITIETLTCDFSTNQFHIDYENEPPEDIPRSELIFVRCFAETQYFCNYPPTTTSPIPDGNMPLVKTPPNVGAKKPTELKCPDGHPHLVIDNVEKPIPHPKFVCTNFGVNSFWTVSSESTDFMLAKGGRAVSCTKELDCQRMWKIPDSSVDNGIQDGSGLPICHDSTGTLTVNDQNVTDKRCDRLSGKFQYAIGNEEPKTYRDVDKTTIFKCIYPKPIDVEKNEANNFASRATQIGIVVAVVIVGIVIIVVIILCSSHRIKKRKKRVEELEKEAMKGEDFAWKKFCMDDEEREKIKKAKQKLLEERKKLLEEQKNLTGETGKLIEEDLKEEESPSSARLADTYQWSRMTIASICETVISCTFGTALDFEHILYGGTPKPDDPEKIMFTDEDEKAKTVDRTQEPKESKFIAPETYQLIRRKTESINLEKQMIKWKKERKLEEEQKKKAEKK